MSKKRMITYAVILFVLSIIVFIFFYLGIIPAIELHLCTGFAALLLILIVNILSYKYNWSGSLKNSSHKAVHISNYVFFIIVSLTLGFLLMRLFEYFDIQNSGIYIAIVLVVALIPFSIVSWKNYKKGCRIEVKTE